MDFRLAFTPKPLPTPIQHQHKLMLVGSCFTENIGAKLKQHKFTVLENPHGILFNPASIHQAMLSYTTHKQYSAADLFYANECWNSWEHHSRFSHPNQAQCVQQINASQTAAHQFIQTAQWVLITLGSAFVYYLQNGDAVANCHKVPTDKFDKKLLSVAETTALLASMIEAVVNINPNIQFIFTISPVRHLRDGFVENNRSKATLIHAVHELADKFSNVHYFPAYELVIDDLRDYRFYAEDMVHPNYTATNYVWSKFVPACIDESSQTLMKAINIINAAKAHRPFHPQSEQHNTFLQKNLEKVQELQIAYPYIDFTEELMYFQ